MVVMGQSMGSKLWSLVVNGERTLRGKERPGDREEAETEREREKRRVGREQIQEDGEARERRESRGERLGEGKGCREKSKE